MHEASQQAWVTPESRDGLSGSMSAFERRTSRDRRAVNGCPDGNRYETSTTEHRAGVATALDW
jgi:hypothetical protein